ncbi:MaoC family dehydratase [Ancylobacter defluvii]|uniref:MaoC family dehydratase n=1 Tax=Ancylobacter defluvii TaxID=1282440 RepID=A0A9W6NAM1_9HYPH|nr:MaoC family dehydratase [Ancylobacter defluvii]MBS7588478.1 MaoC family dehydratase [Ancylobacter defluvii]GLK83758.1 MaoC family dehydratase [Ancylobacter defluvii]
MKIASLTSKDSYFEAFTVGEVMRHARGKTVEPLENVLITNLVMNTASGHFDEHAMKDSPFGRRVTFGGVTASLVIGMASQDTAENALAEIGMTGLRLKSPVFHGDTLYSYTEVLAKEDAGREDAGIVTFKHWGVNQDDVVVCECVRRVLVKRASHWGAA